MVVRLIARLRKDGNVQDHLQHVQRSVVMDWLLVQKLVIMVWWRILTLTPLQAVFSVKREMVSNAWVLVLDTIVILFVGMVLCVEVKLVIQEAMQVVISIRSLAVIVLHVRKLKAGSVVESLPSALRSVVMEFV